MFFRRRICFSKQVHFFLNLKPFRLSKILVIILAAERYFCFSHDKKYASTLYKVRVYTHMSLKTFTVVYFTDIDIWCYVFISSDRQAHALFHGTLLSILVGTHELYIIHLLVAISKRTGHTVLLIALLSVFMTDIPRWVKQRVHAHSLSPSHTHTHTSACVYIY